MPGYSTAAAPTGLARRAAEVPFVNQHASPEAKIALFRGLFRGRDDVYPRRFESRGGSVGVCLAVTEEDDPTPWSAPACGRRSSPPVAGPLPETMNAVLGNETHGMTGTEREAGSRTSA